MSKTEPVACTRSFGQQTELKLSHKSGSGIVDGPTGEVASFLQYLHLGWHLWSTKQTASQTTSLAEEVWWHASIPAAGVAKHMGCDVCLPVMRTNENARTLQESGHETRKTDTTLNKLLTSFRYAHDSPIKKWWKRSGRALVGRKKKKTKMSWCKRVGQTAPDV